MLKKDLKKLIDVSSEDDFLYVTLTKLLNDIKLARGGIALDSTLKQHDKILYYLMSKQVQKIQNIETKYFNDDGTLKKDIIHDCYLSRSKALHTL